MPPAEGISNARRKTRYILKRFIDRNPNPQLEPDEPAVAVFVTSGDNVMADIAKRAQELLGTPEGMAKALELEPWEKE